MRRADLRGRGAAATPGGRDDPGAKGDPPGAGGGGGGVGGMALDSDAMAQTYRLRLSGGNGIRRILRTLAGGEACW